jgi:hypothetical protein
MEIPVDINQNSSLVLSEISEELIAIEPELTDESLLKSDAFRQRIVITENRVIIVEATKALLFDKNGKFRRSFSSIGQGPGEYTGAIIISAN